uniref:TSA: Wollemia nobilis Ref_Wollemi_Transcript_13508_1027 transcribed RNA sequence n=1 Tax=Wollemia nobilis TaxID=56998 RepID=A0A0C9S4Z8_9CONI
MAGVKRISVLTMTIMILVVVEIHLGFAQNCGCTSSQCCSKWGYCGTTNAYCGDGCKSGPCHNKPSPSVPAPGSSSGIESIITEDFFNRIRSGISSSCAGKNFYTYNGFIDAAKAQGFAGFGTTGTLVQRKRELAAFFANVAHETGSLCYVEEIKKATYCQNSAQWPCQSNKKYYGRGPLQLTWNYNYGLAGKYTGLPLLTNPDLVAQRPDVAFKTSVWFWMISSNCHKAMTSSGGTGFAGTIRAINGGECGGGRPAAVQSRVDLYKKFSGWLDVTTGSNLSC